jgi:predicted RNase H-like nuclease (RuvC/YqgF family)
MKVHKTTDEITLLIEEYKKEIWEWKQKESEWINTKNLADGYKKVIEELSSKLFDQEKYINNLQQEIEKLVEEKNK